MGFFATPKIQRKWNNEPNSIDRMQCGANGKKHKWNYSFWQSPSTCPAPPSQASTTTNESLGVHEERIKIASTWNRSADCWLNVGRCPVLGIFVTFFVPLRCRCCVQRGFYSPFDSKVFELIGTWWMPSTGCLRAQTHTRHWLLEWR